MNGNERRPCHSCSMKMKGVFLCGWWLRKRMIDLNWLESDIYVILFIGFRGDNGVYLRVIKFANRYILYIKMWKSNVIFKKYINDNLIDCWKNHTHRY